MRETVSRCRWRLRHGELDLVGYFYLDLHALKQHRIDRTQILKNSHKITDHLSLIKHVDNFLRTMKSCPFSQVARVVFPVLVLVFNLVYFTSALKGSDEYDGFTFLNSTSGEL